MGRRAGKHGGAVLSIPATGGPYDAALPLAPVAEFQAASVQERDMTGKALGETVGIFAVVASLMFVGVEIQ